MLTWAEIRSRICDAVSGLNPLLVQLCGLREDLVKSAFGMLEFFVRLGLDLDD